MLDIQLRFRANPDELSLAFFVAFFDSLGLHLVDCEGAIPVNRDHVDTALCLDEKALVRYTAHWTRTLGNHLGTFEVFGHVERMTQVPEERTDHAERNQVELAFHFCFSLSGLG